MAPSTSVLTAPTLCMMMCPWPSPASLGAPTATFPSRYPVQNGSGLWVGVAGGQDPAAELPNLTGRRPPGAREPRAHPTPGLGACFPAGLCQGGPYLLRKASSSTCMGLGWVQALPRTPALSHPWQRQGSFSSSGGSPFSVVVPAQPGRRAGVCIHAGGCPSTGTVLYLPQAPQQHAGASQPRMTSMSRSTSLAQPLAAIPCARRRACSRQRAWIVRAASWQRLYLARAAHART